MSETTLKELNKKSLKMLLIWLSVAIFGAFIEYLCILYLLDYFLVCILPAIPIGLGLWGVFMSIVELAGNKGLQESNERYYQEQELLKEEVDSKNNIFNEFLKTKTDEHGVLTKIISWECDYIRVGFFDEHTIPNIEKSLLVFESSETLIIANKIYKFRDIVSFEVFDNSQTIYSGSVSTTKTKTGSMLGRAAVGGLLLGGVGAIVGGTTAGKETVTEGQATTTTHDYSIVVTVNNLSNPIIKINLGADLNSMQEITSILSIITSR